VDQVGNALKAGWDSSADDVAKALKGADYNVDEVGNYLKSAYDLSSDGLSSALRGAGYAKDEVNKLFKSWGGKFADYVSDIDWTGW
jgi:hypothetical protein